MARVVLQALLLALVIPAVATFAIVAANDRLEADWASALTAEFGPQPAATMDQLRLVRVCRDPEFRTGLPDTCQLSDIAALAQPAGVGAIALSIALLAALVPFHLLARRDRRILAMFRPALLLLLVALTVLVVLDGGLVAAAAYLAEMAFVGGVHPFVVFGIGVAVFVATTGVLRSAVTMGRHRPIPVKGLVLERERDERLFEIVDDIAARVGTSAPDQIVAGLDPTFFVTEGPVKGFDGTSRGRTLFLSVPFIRILSRSELIAVIGHELGHFRGADTVYSRRFYSVYRGSIESLAVLQVSSRGLLGIPLLPPLRILELFFLSFASAERGLSRQRELAADVVGAEASSADDLGSALIKLESYGAVWSDAYAETTLAARDRRDLGNVSARFSQLAGMTGRRSHLSDLDHGRISHPTDSHPRTSERLAALDVDVAGAIERALTVRPAEPAFDLIDDGPALEADLMEDLAEELAGAANATGERAPVDPSATLRAAAADDPAIAAIVELEEEIRGRDLQPWIRATQDWTILADLDVRPHSEPTGFDERVGAGPLPAGEQWLVVGLASERTPIGLRVTAGGRISLIGISVQWAREAGRTELMFNSGGRIMTIRVVGEWPIDHQLGGLLVVPISDPLAGEDSAFRDRLSGAVAGLVARDAARPGAGPEAGSNGAVVDPAPALGTT